MKDRLNVFVANVADSMKEALRGSRYDSVPNLSSFLERGRRLQGQYSVIEREVQELEAAFAQIKSSSVAEAPLREYDLSSNGDRAEPTTLRITIDWQANGKHQNKEVIVSSKATEAFVRFIARLSEEYGRTALELLSQVRVNRGPLISRNPQRDFGSYQNKGIRGTDFFLLTHSSTPEKAEVVKRVSSILELVAGSVQVEVIKRSDARSFQGF
jgi:hypothetical protein